jgi:hypothetical protein
MSERKISAKEWLLLNSMTRDELCDLKNVLSEWNWDNRFEDIDDCNHSYIPDYSSIGIIQSEDDEPVQNCSTNHYKINWDGKDKGFLCKREVLSKELSRRVGDRYYLQKHHLESCGMTKQDSDNFLYENKELLSSVYDLDNDPSHLYCNDLK